MGKQMYRLLLDDYSAASFTSMSKEYFGTLDEIAEFMSALADDKDDCENQKELLGAYTKFCNGEKDITHNVAYREVPFLVRAKTLCSSKTEVFDYSWEHLNTWHFPYYMKCDRAESTHIWLSCRGEYYRCIQTSFTNLCYSDLGDEYNPMGSMIWGFPQQIAGRNGNLRNRLFVVEKRFKNKFEAMRDYASFEANKDVCFAEILNDIFGDG